MKRVLFVDDEPRLLEGLRRMLHGWRQQWEMEFVTSGEEALRRLKDRAFDVVVTDMRMPGMDGAQLLEHVRQHSPATVRMVLSGHSDRDAVRKTAAVAHQFLAKPCDSEVLASTVSRACRVQSQLGDPSSRAMVSSVTSVASSRRSHARLLAELESEEPSVERIGEVVARDVAMTAKLLQLVSSSFTGCPQSGSDPAHWTAWLGLDVIKLLVMKDHAAHVLEAGGASDAIEALTVHSLRVAQGARSLMASETADADEVERACLAGLLHDVGWFIFAEHGSPQLSGSSAGDGPILVERKRGQSPDRNWEIERAGGGASHAELGAYLLALWGAPDALVETIAFHHHPSQSSATTFGVLTAVHVADAVAAAAAQGAVDALSMVDVEHLKRIGGVERERLEQWCGRCRAGMQEVVSSSDELAEGCMGAGSRERP